MIEFIKKLEYYCAYQERCHQEVIQKLYQLKCPNKIQEEIITHLIINNFLNEERFASIYAVSKFHQKCWGKLKIENELKQKNISSKNIQIALNKIEETEYLKIFNENAPKIWNSLIEKNQMKKLKKFTDYWLRKGFENDLIYQKAKELLK